MTDLPDDRIDPYEPRLARRVGEFADQAVRPFDAAAIAAAARAGAGRRPLAVRLFGFSGSTARLGMLLAGALVAVVAAGTLLTAGGTHLFNPNQTFAGPVATPTAVAGAAQDCRGADLSGGITAWEGAAGHRIATVEVRNTGPGPCLLPQYVRPALVDTDGNALIVAQLVREPAPIMFAAGATATTMVDMANYCGAAPTGQLLLRFYLPTDDAFEATDKRRPRTLPDVPPCNGPAAPATIDMHPFTLN